jgi:hypothetical protein
MTAILVGFFPHQPKDHPYCHPIYVNHFIHVTLFTCMQSIVEAPILDEAPIVNLQDIEISIKLGLNSN